MDDPLFKRAELAIEACRSSRVQRQALMKEQEAMIYELRWAIFESACVRAESRARREDK